jgi:hypothetical protein
MVSGRRASLSSRHRLKRPVRAGDHVAVGKRNVGDEIAVAAFLPQRFADMQWPRRAVRAFAKRLRTGRGLDARRRRRMVAVGVGDQDMRHRLPAYGLEECGNVRLIERPRIDDGDAPAADDVAHRPLERHRPRVVAHDPAQPGAHLLDGVGRQVEAAVERNVVGHAQRLLFEKVGVGPRSRKQDFRSSQFVD